MKYKKIQMLVIPPGILHTEAFKEETPIIIINLSSERGAGLIMGEGINYNVIETETNREYLIPDMYKTVLFKSEGLENKTYLIMVKEK